VSYICRAERQKATPFRFESKDLLALAAYVGLQSRGIPIDVVVDERMQPFLEAGRAMFAQRQGQLNLSYAQCHDDNWGQKLAALTRAIEEHSHDRQRPRVCRRIRDRLVDLIRRFLLRRIVRQPREHAAILVATMI
jgi:hypothetical protein